MDENHLDRMQAEATERFLGQRGVVGVAVGRDQRLTVLVSDADPDAERAMLAWADAHAVGLDVVVAGQLRAGVV